MPIQPNEVNVSDLHATERIIGGLIVVGLAYLLGWNHAQGGDPGVVGVVLTGVMVLGGIWAVAGLVELFASPRRDRGIPSPSTPDHPTS